MQIAGSKEEFLGKYNFIPLTLMLFDTTQFDSNDL